MAAWAGRLRGYLRKEGATVFIAGRNEERGDALAVEINEAGGKAHFVELDVTNQGQWDAATAQVKERAGALHILMNIVGTNALVRFPAVDVGEWNRVFEINVTGTLRGIQTCAPLMKEIRRRLNRRTSGRLLALPAISAPAIPLPSGRWKECRDPQLISMPIGEFAATSSSPVGSKLT